MSRNNDFTTENSSGYSCHQNYCRLIGINLSRQISTTVPQQTNLMGKFKKYDGTKMFFVAEKYQKSYCKLFIRFIKRHAMI